MTFDQLIDELVDHVVGLPYAEAKRRVVSTFNRRYVARQIERGGNKSAGARLSGLERNNFKRLLKK